MPFATRYSMGLWFWPRVTIRSGSRRIYRWWVGLWGEGFQGISFKRVILFLILRLSLGQGELPVLSPSMNAFCVFLVVFSCCGNRRGIMSGEGHRWTDNGGFSLSITFSMYSVTSCKWCFLCSQLMQLNYLIFLERLNHSNKIPYIERLRKIFKFVSHNSEAGDFSSGCLCGQVRVLLQVTGFFLYLNMVEGAIELSQISSMNMITWCFWIVVLEKTLESPLDCKEIQPVHSKDQPWVFFGRNDTKAETPVLWPRHVKSWIIGKDWCWEGLGAGGKGDDRGWDGWMASLTRWT